MNSVYFNEIKNYIETLSTAELKELLDDDEKIDEKIDETLENLKIKKDNLFEENRSKAECNIEKEPQIIELRAKLAELAEEGKQTCQAVQNLLTEIKEKFKGVSNDTTLALLQASAAASEEESEKLVTQFSNNELPVETFIDDFLNKRITMHLRKFKAEKMQEILSKDSGTSSEKGFRRDKEGYNYPPIPNHYPTPPAASSSVPYPIIPNMPMPMPMPSARPF